MRFQKFQVVIGPDREIEVKLSGKAYVKLMDRINFYLFQNGEKHEYYGKEEMVTYVKIKPPSLGRWFIIVDTSESSENILIDWKILD